MATIKAVLRMTKQREDGSFPVSIRISEGTRNKYITVGQFVFEKDWDKAGQQVRRSNPNYDYINSLIRKKKAEAEKMVLEIVLSGKEDEVLDSIGKKQEKKVKGNFFVLAQEYLKDLYLNKKFSRVSAEKSRVKHFQEFLLGKDIQFNKIDPQLLNKFASYLRNKKVKNKDGKSVALCGERTIMNHMVVIRCIYNLAIQQGVASHNDYPFGKGRFRIKYPDTIKIGLNEEEVKIIENADFSDKPNLDHVRRVWLFSFYMAGMRISDVLRLNWNDFTDYRLNYTMGKNKKNVSLKLPDKAAAILDYYKGDKEQNNGFVFPEMRNVDRNDAEDMYRNIARIGGKFDKLLKKIAIELGITKPLTNHISRHTFGNITGDKISPQMLQKLYRHSHISTTMGYQANFIHKDVDDALEAVLDF